MNNSIIPLKDMVPSTTTNLNANLTTMLEANSVIAGPADASMGGVTQKQWSQNDHTVFVFEIYEMLKNDRSKFLDCCTDTSMWTIHGPSNLEKCKRWIGREGIKEFFNILDSTWIFDEGSPYPYELNVTPITDTVSGSGCLVMVMGHESGQIKHTDGHRYYNHWMHCWSVNPVTRKLLEMREWLSVHTNHDNMIAPQKALLFNSTNFQQVLLGNNTTSATGVNLEDYQITSEKKEA